MADEYSPWRFDAATELWMESASEASVVEARTLTVMTFNIWFSKLWFEERAAAVLQLALDHGADIIALQEVTPDFLETVLIKEWVREGYCVSDALGETIFPYGNLIVSRFPVQRFVLHEMPSMMGRKLLVAEMELNGESFHVGTVHLESGMEEMHMRMEQLDLIQPILRNSDHALLTGDFNFCASWDHENDVIEPDFQDLWTLGRPDDPGYTEDTEVNVMRREMYQERVQVRFDRMLFRSRLHGWRLRSIQLLGNEPVSPSRPDVFPSDHFGLVATLDHDDA